jgi:hypothetical protein
MTLNTHDSLSNQRRAQRKRAAFTAIVTDVITGKPLGHLGNLSISGLLLISSNPPRSEGLYQVSLPLPESGQPVSVAPPIELGIQEQWQDLAASPGQVWAGYRIVAISDADAARLDNWLTHP